MLKRSYIKTRPQFLNLCIFNLLFPWALPCPHQVLFQFIAHSLLTPYITLLLDPSTPFLYNKNYSFKISLKKCKLVIFSCSFMFMSDYVDIYLLYQWIEPSYINLADDNNFFEKKKKIKYKKKTETLHKICKSSKQRNIIYLDVKST